MAMPVFSRSRFQRIKIGPNITIEVLETGATLLKIEITATQGRRILRGERKLWEGQTMERSKEELERATAKKLGMTHEELLERMHPEKLADIRDTEKLTKLIIERKQFESVKIGRDIYLQVLRVAKVSRMGIEAPRGTKIELLDVSAERTATEAVRRRDASHRHKQWIASGGPGRAHAERRERQVA